MLVETAAVETESEEATGEIAPLRRAYDRIISGMEAGRPQMVFDEFWREGELALMFGESGVGKSLLAMRLADTLAAGGDIPWFRMECPAGKTLHVDLSMSDRQFASRHSYSGEGGEERALQVSTRLYCDRPVDEQELIEWLERQIEAEKLRYVIIDDLSMLMRSCDGTRDTVAVMRGLRRICGRFGVSILVVMQSEGPKANARLSERDLGRQRSLCRMADSVFGIGHNAKRGGSVYLAHTRSHSSKPQWTVHNAIQAKIIEHRGSLFIEFEMNVSEEERALINALKDLRRLGLSFREVAVKLRISKSRAHRLDRRWYQMLEGDIADRIKNGSDEDEWDDEEYEDEAEDTEYLKQIGEIDRPAETSASSEPQAPPLVIGPWQGPKPCPPLAFVSGVAAPGEGVFRSSQSLRSRRRLGSSSGFKAADRPGGSVRGDGNGRGCSREYQIRRRARRQRKAIALVRI